MKTIWFVVAAVLLCVGFTFATQSSAKFGTLFHTQPISYDQMRAELYTKFNNAVDDIAALIASTAKLSATGDTLTAMNKISGNPVIDSISGMDCIKGYPLLDSIKGLVYVQGYPLLDSAKITRIANMDKIQGNPITDSLSAMDCIKGNPLIDSAQIQNISGITKVLTGQIFGAGITDTLKTISILNTDTLQIQIGPKTFKLISL